MTEPGRPRHHAVELVAVDDEQPAPVGRLVDGVADHQDAAELVIEIAAQHVVMVARRQDHAGALAGLAQEFLDHVVMALRPVAGAAHPPEIDDVADQIQRVAFDRSQEV